MISFFTEGCYYLKGGIKQLDILTSRKSFEEVMSDSQTTSDEKNKLTLIKQAREFAIELGLTPKGAFTKYSKIDSDVLSWIVMGSKKDAFSLKTWWFPIVGTVPYKGYFDKDDADILAASLEKEGYESSVRGSIAFSSLGWFDDPVLTPLLKRNEYDIVSTVIHECVHTTFWIPDNVPANETIAQFIGVEGAIKFFEKYYPENKVWNDYAKKRTALEYELGTVIANLYKELDELYKSTKTSEEKISERELVFQKNMSAFKAKYPNIKILEKMNNADLMQLYIYLGDINSVKEKFHGDLTEAIKNY